MYRGIILSFLMIFFLFSHCSSGQGIAWSASRSAPSSSGSASSSSSDSSCGMSYCNRSIASMISSTLSNISPLSKSLVSWSSAPLIRGRSCKHSLRQALGWSRHQPWNTKLILIQVWGSLFPDASAAGAGGLIVGGFSWKQNHLTKICITMHLFYLLINN